MSGPVRPEDVEALIERFQASDCTELHVRFEGFELHLSTDAAAGAPTRIDASTSEPPPGAPAPSAKPAEPRSATLTPPVEAPDGLEIVRAPYQGLFYRAPKPGDPPFVEIGAEVEPETDLCLIEVMKLFTAVRAGMSGAVVEILAADGAMVDGGQPLFALAPRG